MSGQRQPVRPVAGLQGWLSGGKAAGAASLLPGRHAVAEAGE